MAQNKQELAERNNVNANSIGFDQFINTGAVKRKIDSVIGGERGQRFIASIVSAVTTNEQLKQCTNTSVFSAALLGESLNLSPSPQLGQYYLVPFNDKDKGRVAQFQLGYKGYIQLAIRSGQYKDIDVIEVRKGEYLGRDSSTGKHQFKFINDDDKREELEVIGYLAYFEYLNGFTKQVYWTKEKMQTHARKYSQAYRSDLDKGNQYSFWSKDFDDMARKTVLRQLISKWGIMSIDMQKAYESDMAVINDEDKSYVDNTPEINISENIVTDGVQEKPEKINIDEL